MKPGQHSSFVLPLLRRIPIQQACFPVLIWALTFLTVPMGIVAAPPEPAIDLRGDSVRLQWRGNDTTVVPEQSPDLINWNAVNAQPNDVNGVFSIDFPLQDGVNYLRLREGEEEEPDPNAPVYSNPPEANPSLFPGETITFTLAATDPNGLPVTFGAEPLPLPQGASLNMDTGVFSWTPRSNQTGAVTVTFLASNGTNVGKLPISFNVQEPPVDGETSLAGVLLDANAAMDGDEIPIVGAVVSLLGMDVSSTTGADGRFLLSNIPDGDIILDLDTKNAENAPNGDPYAGFREAISIVERVSTDVTRPFYLPRIAMSSMKKVEPNFTTEVNNPDLGISLTVPPHTAMMEGEEFTGELSISPVPDGLAPAAMPPNLGFGSLITIQPVGVRFTQPVPITFRNNDDLAPGSETDIWSIDPEEGVFAIVGKGRVTDDGQSIETIEGGIVAADWHDTLPPTVPPENGPGSPSTTSSSPSSSPPVSDGPPDGGHGPGGCPGDSAAPASGPFGSDVLLANGAVITSLRLAAYQSGNSPKTMTLGYHSQTAYPQIVVPVRATIPVRSAVPRLMSIEGTLGGLVGRNTVFYDTSNLSESRDETIVGGFVLDASGLGTGFAPYTTTVTNHFARSTVSASSTSQAVVYDRANSPFGAGWGIHGIQRIIRGPEGSDRQLLVSGDGSYTLFRNSASAFTLAAFGRSRASDYSFSEGDLFTEARSAILESFEGSSIVGIDSIGEAAADILVMTPFASPTRGLTLSSIEQTALTRFIRGGGAAIMFLDHDLSRASFKDAIESLLDPFGLRGRNLDTLESEVESGDHPLLSGNFGNVDQFNLPFGGFELETTGSVLDNILPGSSSSLARIAILPEDALAEGSGPVVFIADTQSFTNNESFGFSQGSAQAALLLNALNYCRIAQRDPSAQIEYVGTPDDFSRLIERPDGTFQRRHSNGSSVHFNAQGQMQSIEERDGQTSQFRYNTRGNLIEAIDPFGQRTQLQYSDGKLRTLTDPTGRVTSLRHDSQGDLIEVTFPDASTNSFEYDSNHLMTAEVNALGGRTERQYDANGRALFVRLPDGTERRVRSIQGIATDLGGKSGTELDPAPIKRVTDLIAVYTNAAGEEYTVATGPLGSATELTMPDGTSDTIRRNESGKSEETRFASGREFTFTYDQHGRRTSLTDSATGGTWSTVYDDALGAPLIADNGGGQQASIEYDEQGRRILYSSFEGREFQWEYEGTKPHPSKTVAYNGLETQIEYDGLGNTTRLIQGAGETSRVTSLRRNDDGQVREITSATGDVFTYDHDAAGRIIREAIPDGAALSYVRNPQGLPTTITLPSGAEQVYTYDNRGRMTSSTSPIGTDLQTTYHYESGRLARVATTGGPEIQYQYEDGRLVKAESPAGETTYAYNESGLMNRLTSPEGNTIDYTFDEAGRVVLEQWSGDVIASVGRSYDSLGRIASLEVGNGPPASITYDADNLILSNGPLTLSRDTNSGMVLGSQLGNCTDTRTYNAFGELISIVGKFNEDEIYRTELERDRLGRITRKIEVILGSRSQYQYGYDLGGRLSSVEGNGSSVTYTYDANGNRLTRIVSGTVSESGSYNEANQIREYAGDTYTYDRAGRLRNRSEDSFVYDAYGRLTSFTADGTSLEFQHDPLGRRIGEISGNSIRRQFIYQNALQPIAELDGEGNVRSRFGYASLFSTPDYMQRDGVNYRIFCDHQGSPRLVINAITGEIVQRLRHDAFGRVLEDSSPGFQPFGFAGGLYDPGTRLLRFGARDYDPYTGQWTAVDPIGYSSGSFNLYSYVSGDPVNRIDFNGLEESSGPSVTIGGTAGLDVLFWGFSVSGGLTFDGSGNVGISLGYSAGNGVGAEGDISFMAAVTKGDIYKADGPGHATGGGGGLGVVGEVYRLTDANGNFSGVQVSAGEGGGVTAHHHETNTIVRGFNVPDAYNTVTNWVR